MGLIQRAGPSAVFLGTLLVAVIIPLVLNTLLATKLSGVDQFLIGVMIYVALTLTTQADHLRRLDASATAALDLWRIRSDFDRRLNNIRESYYALTANPRVTPDFYSAYFARSLELYETTINDAVSNFDLRVDEKHLSTTDMLLACFQGRDGDTARFVHYFSDNGWLFDTWAKNYCVRLFRLIESGKLREVRRLFIYRDPGEQEWDQSKRLMEFHAANKGYDYRVIPEATYRQIVRDFHMREFFKDFGIYGEWYVYLTIAAVPEQIEGVFSSSERKVQDFIQLFDQCWNLAPVPPKADRGPMPPDELFQEHVIPVSVGSSADLGPPKE